MGGNRGPRHPLRSVTVHGSTLLLLGEQSCKLHREFFKIDREPQFQRERFSHRVPSVQSLITFQEEAHQRQMRRSGSGAPFAACLPSIKTTTYLTSGDDARTCLRARRTLSQQLRQMTSSPAAISRSHK
jgi:hypothetical protein